MQKQSLGKPMYKYYRILITFLLAASINGFCCDSLAEKIGQLIVVGFRGTELDIDHPIAKQVAAGKIGGVILFNYDSKLKIFGRNILSSEQLKALTFFLQGLSASHPLLIAIDQEGGMINRFPPAFGFPITPSAKALGALNDIGITEKESANIANALKRHGVNWNLAPVVDLDVNPDSPAIGRKERSFSADPNVVYAHSKAFIQAHRQAGVLTAIKHFPGHGSACEDSHLGITDITATWSEKELIPYRRLIEDQNVDSIMLSHVWHRELDPAAPASLSVKIVQEILRKKLQFDGVIVTDDLQMKAISDHYSLRESIKLALLAGADILLFANQQNYQENIAEDAAAVIMEMVKSGEIPLQRILDAHSHVMKLKSRL